VIDLARCFDAAERNALLRILNAHHDLHLADLRALIGCGRLGRVIRSITLREVMQGVADPNRRSDPAAKVEARERIETHILNALRAAAEPLSASELIAQISEHTGSGEVTEDSEISEAQRSAAAAALQRLAASNKIRRTLKSRVPAYRLR